MIKRLFPEDISEYQIEEALSEITNFFDCDWLLDGLGKHALQVLWNRDDEYSTLELYSFGVALRKMKNLSSTWLNGQIKLIKGSDENNRRGAFFEIIGLSYIDIPSAKVIPAANSQPGFDAVILSSSNETRISCKSYGRSNHDKKFEAEGRITETYILDAMQKWGLYYAEFLILFESTYPEISDWNNLRSILDDVIREFNEMKSGEDYLRPYRFEYKNWIIEIGQSSRLKELSPRLISYKITIAGKYHKNEIRNLYSKLNEAHQNLNQHTINHKGSNIIFVRIPLTISVDKCAEWTLKYFEDNPKVNVHLVIFYQCRITLDTPVNKHTIVHVFLFAPNPFFPEQVSKIFDLESQIKFIVPWGHVTFESPKLFLFDKDIQYPIEDYYIYQKGAFYTKAAKNSNGSFEGDFYNFGNGIQELSVIEDGEKTLIVSGIFPENAELLIL